MTILNTDSIGNYVAIVPIKTKFTDTVDANILTAMIISDNLTNGCVIQFILWYMDNESSITSMLQDTLSITGTDYTDWQGDSSYVYTYIANKLGLTLL